MFKLIIINFIFFIVIINLISFKNNYFIKKNHSFEFEIEFKNQNLNLITNNNKTVTATKKLRENSIKKNKRNEDLCKSESLSPSLWERYDMNAYLDNYQNGTKLNLEEYATKVGASDFQCGIGRICNPGQLCESVFGRDWYALIAAQNWNAFLNIIYQAAGDAFDVTSDILPTMLIDFEKDYQRTPRHFTAWSGLISNWISSFPASLFKAYGNVIESISMSIGTVSWLGLVMLSYQMTALGWLETFVLIGESGKNRFKRSSFLTWMLSQAQEGVQQVLSNITEKVIMSSISDQQLGLSSINRDGIFFSTDLIFDQRELVQKEYEKILKLKTLIKIWRIQNVFIVRGSASCSHSGPNGAYEDPDLLSYCGEDAIMMNIVKAETKGDRIDPKIYGANLLLRKYNFTVEYLITTSWECQKKYNQFDFNPNEIFGNSSVLKNLDELEDCVVNLPVCDCTKPEMIKALRKGHSITKACREINRVPI